MVGTDGPKMSASNNPTLYPSLESDIARFAAMVLFPTPPFPEETAITFVPLNGFAGIAFSSKGLYEMFILTLASSEANVFMAASAAFVTDLVKGSGLFGKIMEKETF